MNCEFHDSMSRRGNTVNSFCSGVKPCWFSHQQNVQKCAIYVVPCGTIVAKLTEYSIISLVLCMQCSDSWAQNVHSNHRWDQSFLYREYMKRDQQFAYRTGHVDKQLRLYFKMNRYIGVLVFTSKTNSIFPYIALIHISLLFTYNIALLLL